MKFSGQIIKKVKRRKGVRTLWSREKDAQYKDLVAKLESHKFVVRREELKRGHCWKVQSGACRSLEQRFIFVDSRLSPDEQIAFLSVTLGDVVTGDDSGAHAQAA